MAVKKLFLWAGICAFLLNGRLYSRNVFVMPSGGATTTTVISGETFVPSASLQASSGAFLTLSNPGGTRYYVIGASAVDTVVVTDGNFNPVTRLHLGQPATAAALTPDGTRLLVATGSVLHIIDTGSNTKITDGDLGAVVTDIASEQDSSRIYALTPSTQRLTAISMATNSMVGTGSVPASPTAVAMGPNGLLYVSADNRIAVIDGSTMTVRTGGDIPLNGIGRVGKLSFTPDGNFALGVVQNPSLTGALLIRLDLRTHVVTPLTVFGPLVGVSLNNLIVTSNNRAFATSAPALKLYEISIDSLSINESFVLGGANSGVTAIAASNEIPARYLFVAAQNRVHRIDLSANLISGTQGPLSYTLGALSYAGAASGGPVSGLLKYGDNQSVTAGAVSLPLVLRVTDFAGRPVYGAQVTFTPSSLNVTLSNSVATTNAEGFVQTRALLGTSAVATITASVSGGSSTTFTLNAGGSPGTTGGLQIVSGNGQLVSVLASAAPKPLTVVLKDQNGIPVPNTTVFWEVVSGVAQLTATSSVTDANGQASVNVFGNTAAVPDNTPYQQTTIRASTLLGSSVDFYLTVLGKIGSQPMFNALVNTVSPSTDTITGKVGQTIAGAIQVGVFAQNGVPIPNVGLEVAGNQDPQSGPVATCANALTNAAGLAQCDLVITGRPGTGMLTVTVGGGGGAGRAFPLNLDISSGDPATFRIVQGDNQTGAPGEKLPTTLIAEVRDEFGNLLVGVPVQWSLAVPGSAILSNASTISDGLGRVSTTVTLGTTPGDVTVRVRSGSATGAWTLHVTVAVSDIIRVSGNNQTAIINQAFAEPLVVEVRDTQNRPVPNTPVTFAVTSGSATLGSTSATTDAQGRASTTLQAGGTAGAIVVSATAQGKSVTFNLNSRPPGPVIAASGFVNGADFQPGIAPGAIVTLRGSGLAPGVQGCVSPASVAGPLPTTLAGVTVTFGTHAAPIYSVCNIDGQEQVSVQAPFELAPGMVPVEVKVGSGSTIVSSVPVKAAHPGIFEMPRAGGRPHAVLVHLNGTFVTPENPAKRGETLRVYVTGLGPVLPLATTNCPGAQGQKVYFPVIIGVNNAGVRVLSAEYAENMIGVYVVTFEVPADAPVGQETTLQIGVQLPDGQVALGAGSRFAVAQ